MKTFKILTLVAIMVVISAFAVNAVVDNDEFGYRIGDKAADFYLRNVDGEMVSMKDYQEAKGFIIIFTCNTCPFSIANEDRINALDKKYKTKGYPVIAINPNDPSVKDGESYAEMKERSKEKQFSFPYLADSKGDVYPTYGATKTPHVYLLQRNAEKEAIVKYIGAIDDNTRDAGAVKEKFLENAVDALVAGKEIRVKETKAIGCSIKS